VLVERLGQSDQRWYIDGVAQPSSSVCEGPGGCLLELRRCRSTQAWQLLVNGMIVEDYCEGRRATGDPTLRGLRAMPEGSYMIAPQIEAVGLHGDVVQEFLFLAYGQKHAVQVVLAASNSVLQIGSPQAVWEVIFDGHVVARHTGDERGTNAEVGGRSTGVGPVGCIVRGLGRALRSLLRAAYGSTVTVHPHRAPGTMRHQVRSPRTVLEPTA
ncbi:unnamed protein product, partial [Prorocentrum cordatum]